MVKDFKSKYFYINAQIIYYLFYRKGFLKNPNKKPEAFTPGFFQFTLKYQSLIIL